MSKIGQDPAIYLFLAFVKMAGSQQYIFSAIVFFSNATTTQRTSTRHIFYSKCHVFAFFRNLSLSKKAPPILYPTILDCMGDQVKTVLDFLDLTQSRHLRRNSCLEIKGMELKPEHCTARSVSLRVKHVIFPFLFDTFWPLFFVNMSAVWGHFHCIQAALQTSKSRRSWCHGCRTRLHFKSPWLVDNEWRSSFKQE